MTDELLSITNLQTSFFGDTGEIKAVDGVNLSIKKGQTIGIVGESGCGKSVTSLSVMSLFQGTSGRIVNGSIKFEGRELVGLNENEMQELRGNEIAMIFQEPMTSLNPVMRVGRQIEESIRLHMGLTNKKSHERAVEMLNVVGIPRPSEIYHDYPHQLSGGMRQRVMIAIAMSCNPKLLIADEPTTALDVTIQAQILAIMRGLRKTHDMAIMLITHDLAVVAQMCEWVLVMYSGRVVEQGNVYQIFDNPHHPYTRGLYNSVPKMDRTEERLNSIEGVVPNPQDLPDGCKFAPRCPTSKERCLEKEPDYHKVGDDHYCRCWQYLQ